MIIMMVCKVAKIINLQKKIMIPFIGGEYAINLHATELVMSLKRTTQL